MNFENYLIEGFKPILCKGYIQKFNPHKIYKTAKEPVSTGFTKDNYEPPTIEGIQEWVKADGWIGWLIPEGALVLDVEDLTSISYIENLCKRDGISPAVHISNKGKHFLFRTQKAMPGASKINTKSGVPVTYRAGGKNYLILAPVNERTWKLWKPLAELPELPQELHIYDHKNKVDVMRCLSWVIGEHIRAKTLHGYDDIDTAYMVFLIDRGFYEAQVLEAFQLVFTSDYDHSRTSDIYSRTRAKIQNDEVVRGAGSFVQKIKDLGLKDVEVFIRQLQSHDVSDYSDIVVDRHFQQVPKSSTLSTSTPEKKITQVEALLGIASSLVLFYDQNKTTFTYIDNTAIPLSAKKLKDFLSYRYYQSEGKAPNTDAINQTLSVLNGKALFESEQVTMHNRIAEKDGVFWYDLVDGRAVKITPEGWAVTSNVPILFRRYSHQQRQVEPVNGSAWDVFKFLNVDDSHHLLVLVYLISCFVPDIPHPIFHPHGQHGAGKTTFCNVLKLLIDPSSISAIITPRDATQLIQVLSHHHICLFDNMSDLPAWMSDILAQACTGGGFQKRQLFTDEEDIIFQIKRCIGLNGINLLISKSDLMDRSILLHLDRIDPSKRREEKELWEAFEKAKAGILGGIFSTLSKAMAIFPTIQPRALPRMADFAKWGMAITAALGKKPEDFIAAYESNIKRQNEEVIQNSTLAMSVFRLLGDKSEWSGTIKEAYKELFSLADNPARTDNSFPKSERTLKKFLNRIKTNLSDKGLSYIVGDRTAEGIPITFRQVEKTSASNVDNVDEFGTCWKSLDLDSLLIGAEVVQ